MDFHALIRCISVISVASSVVIFLSFRDPHFIVFLTGLLQTMCTTWLHIDCIKSNPMVLCWSDPNVCKSGLNGCSSFETEAKYVHTLSCGPHHSDWSQCICLRGRVVKDEDLFTSVMTGLTVWIRATRGPKSFSTSAEACAHAHAPQEMKL